MDTKINFSFLKVLYILLLIIGIYQILVPQAYLSAAATLGIALAFDPFDPTQPWKERPTWQKAWLVIHLAIVALLFGYSVGIADKF